jgi:hypothetical protein
VDPLADVDDLRRLTGAAWVDQHAALLALRAASGQVRTYCGWAISREDHAEAVVDCDGGRVVTVPCLYLTEVHTVEAGGTPLTDYEWSRTGVLFRRAGWPAALRGVRVVYSGGYTDIPPELVAVVCGLAGRLSVPAGVASWSVGSQTVTFNSEAAPGLASVEETILDRYRIFGS